MNKGFSGCVFARSVNAGKVLIFSFLAFVAAVPLACTQSPSAADERPEIRHIEPNAATGTSLATVAEGSMPLAHTEQFIALNQHGTLVGAGNAETQADRVVENIRLALADVGAGLEDVLRLNVYVTQNEIVEQVKKVFAETFTGEAKPAASFVVTDLPHPEALVAMDAVAAVSAEEGRRQRAVFHVDTLYGASGRGHVALLPPGERVYISGQVAPGELLTATRGTMESLHATLAYLGLTAADVVQVKAYMPDISRADEVEQVIAEYYRQKPAPPIVSVEWNGGSYLWYLSTEGEDATPIEISVIASGGEATETSSAESPLSYATVPDLTAYPTYSRIVVVHRGDIFYTSGLYGDPSKGAAGQVRDVFKALERVLEKTGSDFDRLVKGTYYVTGKAASEALNAIRKELYHPERPPASDKMPVKGVGREGAVVTVNIIGVVPEQGAP